VTPKQNGPRVIVISAETSTRTYAECINAAGGILLVAAIRIERERLAKLVAGDEHNA
jgi:hypothetical protein